MQVTSATGCSVKPGYGKVVIMELEIDRFIEAIASPQHLNMHNPWRDRCDTELHEGGQALRKQRLKRHLMAPNPRLLIIGEAPGYQGCRYSGLAFTSERLLMERAIPRMDGLEGERITDRKKPWSEPSATIVWGALDDHGLADDTVMFNAIPWHPEGSRGIHSNRAPTPAERADGMRYLAMLINVYPGILVAALGNTASATLTELGIEHVKLRHPANGGATLFRNGLAKLIADGSLA